MKARFALVLTGGLLLAACPRDGNAPPPTPPGGPSPPVNGAPIWATQAELVAKKLEELVTCVAKGDKEGALKAHESAYFECYESEKANLEVASMRYLPEEDLGGKMRNVKIVREDLFDQIKAAAKFGAPVEKVRPLVDELETKIRADARTLDEQKVAPP